MTQNTSIEDTLKRLDWLEDYSELPANAKDQIRTLRMHIRFMKTFLVSITKLSNEDMNDFMSHVQNSIQNVRDGLCDENTAVNFEKLMSDWIQEIKKIIPKITTYYISLSQMETTMSNECLVQLVNSLLKNLTDLLKYKTDLTDFAIRQIEALEVKFQFLRNFVWFSSINCINHLNIQDLLALIEVVTSTVACLSFQCLFEAEIDEDMKKQMKEKFSQVLWTIEIIGPGMRDAYINGLKDLSSRLDSSSTMIMGFLRSFLDDVEDLLRYKSSLKASAQVQLRSLREELKFLIALLMDHPKQDDILAHTEAVARKTAPVIHLLLVSMKHDGAINEVVLYQLHDLLNEINLMKKEMRKACPDPSESMRSNFPKKKNASVLIDFVLRALTEVLSYKTESIALVRHQIKIAEAELVCLKFLLHDKVVEEHKEEEDLQMAVTDVVHEAKHAIGSFIIREHPLWYCMLQLSDAIKNIQSVNHKLSAPLGETVEIGVDIGAQSSDSLSSVSTIPVYKMEARGEERNTQAEELKRRLTTGSTGLSVISVVATSKQNVTFLREVFYDRAIVGHFQVCACINVREEYDKRALLIDISIRIVKDAEFAGSVNSLTEEEAAEEMDKRLQKVRYLIVLDNTLSTGTWDTISGCFRNNNNGMKSFPAKELPLKLFIYIHTPKQREKDLERHLEMNQGSEKSKMEQKQVELVKNMMRCKDYKSKLDASRDLEVQDQRKEEHDNYIEHDLNYEIKEDHICIVCGIKNSSFKCKDCEFWIHDECKVLPQKYKCNVHDDHILSLYFLPEEYRIKKLCCDICHKQFQYAFWVYYCLPCRFFVHIKCADKKMTTEENIECYIKFNMVQLPVANAAVKLTNRFLKQNGLLTIPKPEQIVNFHNYDHLLLLSSKINADDELVCDGCIEPIVDDYYYSCQQCSYFLHDSCSQLSSGLELSQHPSHDDQLHINHPKYFFSVAKCSQCQSETNGWSFECGDQSHQFLLDMKCTFIPTNITHKAHKHPLTRNTIKRNSNCNACGKSLSDSASYSCSDCHFYLGIDCALLPPKIIHKWDEHSLQLMYPPFPKNPNDFLCEICEEYVHPKHWVYHCKECDQSFHPHCISRLSENRNIKFGGTIEIAEHNLKLVERGKYKSRCGGCKNRQLDMENALQCTKCDLHICRECALNNIENKKMEDVTTIAFCDGIVANS